MSEFVETMCPVATSEPTRGRWMAHVGSSLFGQYYQMVTEQTPPQAYIRNGLMQPDGAVVYVGAASARHLVRESDGTPAQRLLVQNYDELKEYTDVESMNIYADDHEDSVDFVQRHMDDGLTFAHSMAMGVALAAMRSATIRRTQENMYLSAMAVLGNPQSEAIIRTMSITGFGIYGSSSAPTEYDGLQAALRNAMEAVGTYRYNPVIVKGRIRSAEELAEADMELNPDIVDALRQRLVRQNGSVLKDGDPSPKTLFGRHSGKPAFSSGCPVAHNDYTFSRMRKYLADCTRLTLESFGNDAILSPDTVE